MTREIDVFEIYKDYRNGNKQALSEIFKPKIQYSSRGKIVCNNVEYADKDINNMVKKSYYSFTQDYKFGRKDKYFYRKFSPSCFTGNIDDLGDIFYSELQKIFDSDHIVSDRKELFKTLKYNVTKTVNDIIIKNDTTKELLENYKDNDGKYHISVFDKASLNDYRYKSENKCQNKNHRKFINDLIEILRCCDIKELLPKNNFITRNIIDILLSERSAVYEEESGLPRPIRNIELIELYKELYGCKISESSVSEAYDTIYGILINCLCGYGSMKRTAFEKFYNEIPATKGNDAVKHPFGDMKLESKISGYIKPEKSEYILKMEKLFGREFNGTLSSDDKQEYGEIL